MNSVSEQLLCCHIFFVTVNVIVFSKFECLQPYSDRGGHVEVAHSNSYRPILDGTVVEMNARYESAILNFSSSSSCSNCSSLSLSLFSCSLLSSHCILSVLHVNITGTTINLLKVAETKASL